MSKNNMIARLNYMGGNNQQVRMNKEKLKSLKKALLYSYQAATAILSDGREFKCLINPNRLGVDLDNKILSIPFKDICLNANTMGLPVKEEIETNIKEGDVIEWKENGSHWIVYLQRLEETAYFRADLRRCHSQITLEDNSKHWVYIRGPVEQTILWQQNKGNYFNKLNNTLILYITKNDQTLDYFHRFKTITLNNNIWEVQAVDSISIPGIIEIALKESYNNSIENNIEQVLENIEKEKSEAISLNKIYIFGLDQVYPYDICKYEIKNYNEQNGSWSIDNQSRNKLIKIINSNKDSIEFSIITGKSGSFTLEYRNNDNIIIAKKDITIGSL